MGREMNSLIKTVQATTEPVTLAEAQLHLRLDTYGSPASHPDDTLVQSLISASRESAENYINSTIASCTYQAKDEAIDNQFNLQTYPVTEIVSVTYQDKNGVTQTVSSSTYSIDNFKKPAQLTFDNAPAGELLVTFVAGFTDGQTPNPFPCLASIKAGILLMLGNLYDNRESVTSMQSYERPQSVIYLLTPHRINMGA
jgi:uncharacterized phiE125 gp8 family phage protein